MEHDRHAAEQIGLPHRLERVAEDLELALVLAADVDQHVLRLDAVRRDEAALEEAERDAQHDLAVLEAARLGLVRVHHEVVRLRDLLRLRDERPLATGREERAAAAAQARGVELGDHVLGLKRTRLAQRREAAAGDVRVDVERRSAVGAREDDFRVVRHP